MGEDDCCTTCCKWVCACTCPPCAVLWHRGCSGQFWLNMCLTLFGCIPGCLHACCVVNEDRHEHAVYVNTTVVAPPMMGHHQPGSTNVVLNQPQQQYPPLQYPMGPAQQPLMGNPTAPHMYPPAGATGQQQPPPAYFPTDNPYGDKF